LLGGQLYRQLHLAYNTPTVGLWVHPRDYLNYIDQFEIAHKNDLKFIQGDKNYPVANLSGIEIHFMHFDSEQEAKDKYYRRLGRLNKNKMFTKIDFGKPGYTLQDIERWNQMRIPNSVAFYPSCIEAPSEGIHNGIVIPDWVLDGAQMFDITRKHFNIFEWIRSGKISCSVLYKSMNILLFDPTAPRRIANKAMEATALKRRASS
jgi:uncharacterized protein (DUF1919 family)